MPPRRFALPIIYRRGDGFASFALSVLLHGGIVGVLLFGAYLFPAPAQEEVLPIEAELGRVTASPHVDPAPPPVEAPPQPTPEEVAQQQKAQEEQKEKEQKEQEAQKQAEEQRQQEEAKAAAERAAQLKAAQEKAAAEKAAQLKAAQEKAAEEAAKQKAEAERVAQEKAKAAAAKAAEAKAAEAKRQQDLKNQIEADEKAQAQQAQADAATRAQANELRASWQSAISARIHRAWIEPPVVPTDLRCELHVTQEPDGKVTNVTLGTCNADEAVKESIQAAAYKASPLPSPPDPSIFDRNLFLIFKP